MKVISVLVSLSAFGLALATPAQTKQDIARRGNDYQCYQACQSTTNDCFNACTSCSNACEANNPLNSPELANCQAGCVPH